LDRYGGVEAAGGGNTGNLSSISPSRDRISWIRRRQEITHRSPGHQWIARRDLGGVQRDQMASLVGIAPDLQAVLAPHVAFQFVDRRRLRSPHDVEGNSLVPGGPRRVMCDITRLFDYVVGAR
jgi:hypothetical protein